MLFFLVAIFHDLLLILPLDTEELRCYCNNMKSVPVDTFSTIQDKDLSMIGYVELNDCDVGCSFFSEVFIEKNCIEMYKNCNEWLLNNPRHDVVFGDYIASQFDSVNKEVE